MIGNYIVVVEVRLSGTPPPPKYMLTILTTMILEPLFYLNIYVISKNLFQRSRKCTNLFIYNTQLLSQYIVNDVTKETLRYIKR